MIKVKTKMVRCLCQDPSCKTKNVQRKTMQDVQTVKRNVVWWERAVYRCVCGHSETQAHMDQRMKSKSSGKVSRKEMKSI